ncbi:hypothetical protein [uncultured Parabacteroides sp.]|uniref:hypothetical protein n=1 Tax=uncultured Parabacteroides sp. TaxID=512312 RepID=UPI0026217A25|nr:hypothetical protein [uncultured Parabacteroides sp.]
MKNEYFNMICQKAPEGKMIIMAVVPDNLLGEGLPSIFEVQAVKLVPTIYTGTYPTIKVISETIKDRSDLQGKDIDGIVSGENWYNVSKEDKNTYGININP